MRLAGAVAVLASHAGLDTRSISPRRAVAAQASLFQIRSQYPAQGRFIIRGLLFGKTQRERQPVLLRVVKVPGFHQTRGRQRQTFESWNAEQKTDPMAVPTDHGFYRIIDSRLPWHLHSVFQFLG